MKEQTNKLLNVDVNFHKLNCSEQIEKMKKTFQKEVKEEVYLQSSSLKLIYAILLFTLSPKKVFDFKKLKSKFKKEMSHDNFPNVQKKLYLNLNDGASYAQIFENNKNLIHTHHETVAQIIQDNNEDNLKDILRSALGEVNMHLIQNTQKEKEVIINKQNLNDYFCIFQEGNSFVLAVYQLGENDEIKENQKKEEEKKEEEELKKNKEQKEEKKAEEKVEEVKKEEKKEQRPGHKKKEKKEQKKEEEMERGQGELPPDYVPEEKDSESDNYWFQIMMVIIIIFLLTLNYTEVDLSFLRNYHEFYLIKGGNQIINLIVGVE